MGNFNASQVVNGDYQIPGCRLNPKIVIDLERLSKDPKNKLWQELQESSLRFNQLMQMKLTEEIPSHARVGFIRTSSSQQPQYKENHESNSYKELLTINGKEVSFDLLYNMIGKRFHQCLSEQAKVPGNIEKYYQTSDYELVHQVCRKERLTFYNFLRMNAVP